METTGIFTQHGYHEMEHRKFTGEEPRQVAIDIALVVKQVSLHQNKKNF